MTHSWQRTRRGSSLLEVLVSSSILAVALLGTLSAVLSIHRLDRASRENDLATQGASEVMEEILSSDPATLAEAHDGRSFDIVGLSGPDSDPDRPVGRVTVDESDPRLVEVVVEVEWRGAAGGRIVRFDTLVSRRRSE